MHIGVVLKIFGLFLIQIRFAESVQTFPTPYLTLQKASPTSHDEMVATRIFRFNFQVDLSGVGRSYKDFKIEIFSAANDSSYTDPVAKICGTPNLTAEQGLVSNKNLTGLVYPDTMRSYPAYPMIRSSVFDLGWLNSTGQSGKVHVSFSIVGVSYHDHGSLIVGAGISYFEDINETIGVVGYELDYLNSDKADFVNLTSQESKNLTLNQTTKVSFQATLNGISQTKLSLELFPKNIGTILHAHISEADSFPCLQPLSYYYSSLGPERDPFGLGISTAEFDLGWLFPQINGGQITVDVHFHIHDSVNIIGHNYTLNGDMEFMGEHKTSSTSGYVIDPEGFGFNEINETAVPSFGVIPLLSSDILQVGDTVPLLWKIKIPHLTESTYKLEALMPFDEDNGNNSEPVFGSSFLEEVHKGFNVPYHMELGAQTRLQYHFNTSCSEAEATKEPNKLSVDLGRIKNTREITHNETEDELWYLLSFKVASNTTAGSSQTMILGAYVSDYYMIVSVVQVKVSSILPTQYDLSEFSQFPTFCAELSPETGNQNQKVGLYLDGYLGSLYPSYVNPTLSFEVTVDPNAMIGISDFRVVSAGTNVPCLQHWKTAVGNSETIYFPENETVKSRAVFVVPGCIIHHSQLDANDSSFTVRAVLNPDTSLAEGSYNMTVGLTYLYGTNGSEPSSLLWAQRLFYTHVQSPSIITSDDMNATLVYVRLPGGREVPETAEGQAGAIEYRIEIATGVADHLLVLLDGNLSEDEYCGMELLFVGTSIELEQIPQKVDSAKIIYDFGMVSNVGRTPSNERNHNFIVLTFCIRRLQQDRTLALNITAQTLNGGGNVSVFWMANYASSFSQNVPQVPYFGPYDRCKPLTVVKSVPNHYLLELKIKHDAVPEFSVVVSANHTDVSFCGGEVTLVGSNIPCIQDNIPAVINSQSKLIWNISGACHARMKDFDFSAEMVNMEFVWTLPDSSSLADGDRIRLQFEIQTKESDPALVGEVTVNVTEYSTKAPVTNLTLLNSSVSVPVLAPRTEATVRFFLYIPESNHAQLMISSRVQNTAELHITEFRIIYKGRNIPCADLQNSHAVINSSNSDTYNDQLFVDFGLNPGWVDRMNEPLTTDDVNIVVFEVDVMMTDNDLAENGTSWTLSLTDLAGNGTSYSEELTVIRDGTELPGLVLTAELENVTATYAIGDYFTADILIKHTDSSIAEAVDPVLYIFVPPYVQITNVSYHNHTSGNVTSVTDLPNAQISLSRLLFTDVVMLTVEMKVLPYSPLKAAEVDKAIIPMQVVFRKHEKNGDKHEDFVFFSNMTDITIMTDLISPGCDDPIVAGLLDSQIMASSVKDGSEPFHARENQTEVWSPHLRLDEYHWLMFDLSYIKSIKTVRISSKTNFRKPDRISVQYGFDKTRWYNAADNVSLVYDASTVAEYVFEDPLHARFVRILITEADNSDKEKDWYIGMKLEMFGCDFSDGMETCAAADNVPSVKRWYHYGRGVLAGKGTELYLCDYSVMQERRQCIKTTNGLDWKTVDENVGWIIGYKDTASAVYGLARNKRTFLKSEDGGNVWRGITESEWMASQPFDNTFVEIPYKTETEIGSMLIPTTDWKAKFDGLFLEGKQRLIWNDSGFGK